MDPQPVTLRHISCSNTHTHIIHMASRTRLLWIRSRDHPGVYRLHCIPHPGSFNEPDRPEVWRFLRC